MTFSFIPFSADAISGQGNDNSIQVIHDSNVLLDAARPFGPIVTSVAQGASSTPQFFFGPTAAYDFTSDAEYSLSLIAAVRKMGSDPTFHAKMEVYLVGPAFPTASPFGQLLTTYDVTDELFYRPFEQRIINFTVPKSGKAYLRFVVYGGQWHTSNISIKPAEEFGFTPDEAIALIPVVGHKNETLTFKSEFYDVNNNLFPVSVEAPPTLFDGGTTAIRGTGNIIDGEIKVGASGSGGPTLTTSGFTGPSGIFEPGAPAIFIGNGVYGNPNTGFLVGSSSIGPVISIGNLLTGAPSGGQFILRVSGGLAVNWSGSGTFTNVLDIFAFQSRSIADSIIYGQVTASAALALSMSIMTASLVSNSASLAQGLATESILRTAADSAVSASAASALVNISSSLVSISASLAQKEVADALALNTSISAASGALATQVVSNSASLASQDLSFSSSLASRITATSASFSVQSTTYSSSLAQQIVTEIATRASQDIAYSASLATADSVNSASLATRVNSTATALLQSQSVASASLAAQAVSFNTNLTLALNNATASLLQSESVASASLAAQAISFSASLAQKQAQDSASLADYLRSASFASASQASASINVVDAVNKIILPPSAKAQNGLYLETGSMGFFDYAHNAYGVVINANGQFRFADTASWTGTSGDPYQNVVGFANGAFLVRTTKLFLTTPGFYMVGSDGTSSLANAIKLGANVQGIGIQNGAGFYADGGGNFRVGSDTSGSEYLQFSTSAGLAVNARRLVLNAGGAFLSADTSSAQSGHVFTIGTNAATIGLTTGTGVYMDGAGNFRAGDPSTNFIEFTPSNALRIFTTKLFVTTPSLILATDTVTPSSNVFKLGAAGSLISNTANAGFYVDGGGNFRVGSDTSGSNYIFVDPVAGTTLIRSTDTTISGSGLFIQGTGASGGSNNIVRIGLTTNLTTGTGVFFDGAGNFRAGDPSTNFIEFTPSNALRVTTTKIVLNAGGLFMLAHPLSGSTNVIAMGAASGSNISLAKNRGFYADGAGNFRVGSDASGSNFLLFDSNNSLTTRTGNLILDGGGIYLLGNATSSASANVIKIGGSASGITLTSGVGVYADGGGNVRFGDPAANFFEFTTTNALRVVTTKLALNAGGLYLLAHPASGSTNKIGMGSASGSNVTLTANQGFYADGAGNFRVGTDASGSNYLLFDTNNTLSARTNNLILDGGGIYVLGNVTGSTSANTVRVGGTASTISLTTGTGVYMDGAGNFRAGDPTNYFIEYTPTNALRLKTRRIVFDAGGLYMVGTEESASLAPTANTLRLGYGASSITLANNAGFYVDGAGNFRLGSDTSGSNYVQYASGSGTFIVRTQNTIVDGGGIYLLGNAGGSAASNVIKVGSSASGITLTSGIGSYADGAGNFRTGDPSTYFIEYTPANGTKIRTRRLIFDAGGLYMVGTEESASLAPTVNTLRLGSNASSISLSTNQGTYIDGGGNFRFGSDISGSNYVQFTPGNALVIRSKNVLFDGGGIYMVGNATGSASANVLTVGNAASSITLTTGLGLYADGAGNFRIGRSTSSGEYLQFNTGLNGGAGALLISSSNFFLQATTGSANLKLNQYEFILGSAPTISTFPPTASFTGSYMNNAGQIFFGNANSYIRFGTTGNVVIAGDITILGGNAATTTYVGNATASVTAAAQADALIKAANAVSTASADATSKANTAQTNAQSFASTQIAFVSGTLFTDVNGRVTKAAVPSAVAGLFLGSANLGYHNGTAWKTYMDNSGNFFLAGAGGDSLTWSGGSLTINGAINVTGGNAATISYVGAATASVVSSATSDALTKAQNAVATASSDATTKANTAQTNAQSFASTQIAFVSGTLFTDVNGRVTKAPVPSAVAGLFLGSTNLGYHNGTAWKTYMDNSGNFFLAGAGSDSLTWSGGSLTINGAINVTGGNAATTSYVGAATASVIATAASDATTKANTAQSTAISTAASDATTKANTAQSNAQSFASTQIAFVSGTLFTDVNGRVTKAAVPSVVAGLFLGSTNLGYHNGTTWKTYMDNSGNFFLAGGGSDSLTWSGGVLTINGSINITGGNAATQTFVGTTTQTAVTSSLNNITNQRGLSPTGNFTGDVNGLASSTLTTYATLANTNLDANGLRTALRGSNLPSLLPGAAGLYMTNAYLGFHNGNGALSGWKTYMDSSGNMFLSGAGSDGLSWNSSTNSLTIAGKITLTAATIPWGIRVTPGQNLWTTVQDWTVQAAGSTAPANFNYNGPAAYNSIALAVTPYGNLGKVWIASPSADNNADGGWDANPIPIDPTKTYRYCVWVKRTGGANGSTYHGATQGGTMVNVANGAVDSNPYFVAVASLPNMTGGDWYLMVGFVHPYNYANTATVSSGIYAKSTGTKIVNGTDYRFVNSSVTTLTLRSYLFYVTAGGIQSHFYAPQVHIVDGSEPSIDSILAVGSTAWSYADSVNSSLATTNSNLASTNSTLTATNNSLSITNGNVTTLTNNLATTNSNVTTVSNNLSTTNTNVTNLSNSLNTTNSNLSTVDSKVFTDASGRINRNPSVYSGNGLYITYDYMGYYFGGVWQSYIGNNGHFAFTGDGSNYITWDGATLAIRANQFNMRTSTIVVDSTTSSGRITLGNDNAWGSRTTGFYADGGGYFRVGNASGANLAFDAGSGTLTYSGTLSGAGGTFNGAVTIAGNNNITFNNNSSNTAYLIPYSQNFTQGGIPYVQKGLILKVEDDGIGILANNIRMYQYHYQFGSKSVIEMNAPEIDINGSLYSQGISNTGAISTTGNMSAGGTMTASGFYTSSSRKLKTNIISFTESALDVLNAVNVVKFHYRNDLSTQKVGIIAEDTDVILSTPNQNSLDNTNAIGLLIKAVQELTALIKADAMRK